MNIRDLMVEVESYDFNGRVNAAGDFAGFMRAIREEKAVSELFELMAHRVNIYMIFERLRELSLSESDYRFENKWDVTIAVYLWLISLRDKRLAILAGEIVSGVQQCWWANKMSRSILSGAGTHGSASVQVKSSLGGVFYVDAEISFKHSERAGDSITLMKYLVDESLPIEIWDLSNRLFYVKDSCVGVHWGWVGDTKSASISVGGRSGTLVGEEV